MMGFLNPYDHWANCKVGSTVTTEEIADWTTDFGVLRNVTISTSTLIALDAEKATVQMEIRGAANGAPFELKNTLELHAHPPPEAEQLMSFDQIFGAAAPNVAEEPIDVAGRSLVCRRIDHATTLHGQPFSLQSWTSDQVPGGVVRTEARMGTNHVTKTTVTAYEKK